MGRVLKAIATDPPLANGSPPPKSVNSFSRFEGDKQIFVKDGEHCWIIRVTDIVLIESEGNYSRVHFGSNRAMLYRSLKSIEDHLDPSLFFRANRRIIINLRYVQEIAPWINGGFLIHLTSGPKIEVSRRQASLLRQELAI